MLSWTNVSAEPAKVKFPDAGPAIVSDFIRTPLTNPLIVTVYEEALDAESKITSSWLLGLSAPPAPPDVVDHLLTWDQSPVPPTQ